MVLQLITQRPVQNRQLRLVWRWVRFSLTRRGLLKKNSSSNRVAQSSLLSRYWARTRRDYI